MKLKVGKDGRVTYKIPSGKTIGKDHPVFYEKGTEFYLKPDELLKFVKENRFYTTDSEGRITILVG